MHATILWGLTLSLTVTAAGCVATESPLRVRVFDQATGRPVQNALVEVTQESYREWVTAVRPTGYQSAYTDGHGCVELRAHQTDAGVFSGYWVAAVWVSAPGFWQGIYHFQDDSDQPAQRDGQTLTFRLERNPAKLRIEALAGPPDAPITVPRQRSELSPASRGEAE